MTDTSFWTQAEWAEWSNNLAFLIPEGDESRYSNPEGAQESIIEDCLRAYVKERAAISRFTERAGLGGVLEALLTKHWPNSGVNPWYLADLLYEAVCEEAK